jgi:hypothetical protein
MKTGTVHLTFATRNLSLLQDSMPTIIAGFFCLNYIER